MHFQIALSDRWVSFLEQFQPSYLMLHISLLSIFFVNLSFFPSIFFYIMGEFWRDSSSFLEIRDTSVLDKIITLSRNRGSKINKGKMFLKKKVKKIWEKKLQHYFLVFLYSFLTRYQIVVHEKIVLIFATFPFHFSQFSNTPSGSVWNLG